MTYLGKDKLAALLGVKEALVAQWTRDQTIPPHFYVRTEGTSYQYAPVTVALGELILELGGVFGANSALPKALAKQVLPALERAWRAPEVAVELKAVKHGVLEVRLELGFMARAKQKLDCLAA